MTRVKNVKNVFFTSMVCVVWCVAWQRSPGDRPMYDGPDIPSADLPEDITGPEPQLVPLDVSTLHKVPGYETVGYYTDCEYRIDCCPPVTSKIALPTSTK